MAVESKLIVGNWKMNLTTHEASLYLHKLAGLIESHRDVDVVLAPTLLAIQSLSLQIDRRQFKLAVQNLYWRDHGAYTGEVSASQLKGVVDYAIIGHSERRHIFGETDKDVRNKVQAAIRNHIKPILCIGETAAERADGETNDVIHDQLLGGLANVTSEELEQIAIAYEPVWAISDGVDFGSHKTPTQEDVKLVERAIRRQIKHLYGDEAAKKIKVLYGGSANAENAAFYLNIDGINGLLVGGASLDARAFSEIVNQAHKGSAVAKK
jgi:triosephosphate isomerase